MRQSQCGRREAVRRIRRRHRPCHCRPAHRRDTAAQIRCPIGSRRIPAALAVIGGRAEASRARQRPDCHGQSLPQVNRTYSEMAAQSRTLPAGCAQRSRPQATVARWHMLGENHVLARTAQMGGDAIALPENLHGPSGGLTSPSSSFPRILDRPALRGLDYHVDVDGHY